MVAQDIYNVRGTYLRAPGVELITASGRRTRYEWPDSIAAMVYEPMSRRAVIRFAVAGVVLTGAGLLLRSVSIGAAVGAFLLAVGLFGLAGYGVLDRLVDQWKRARR